MPIYEYQCQACEAVVEELQKISDAPLKKCPECGKNKLEKLVSAPSFRLSGTGWYETDFKGDGDTKRNLATDDSQKEGKMKPDSDKSKSKDGKSDTAKSKSDSKDSGNKATPGSSKTKPKAKSQKNK